MSIVYYNPTDKQSYQMQITADKDGNITSPISSYNPSDEVKSRTSEVIFNFTLGDTTMRKPRREFNDLSVIDRMNYDQMSYNTYLPNDGMYDDITDVNGWRSNAMRPVVRNKVISIAAHATARLIFPKVFAQNEDSEDQTDSAEVMLDLMEWAGDQSDYSTTSLVSTLNALVDPASIVYTEYTEVYRTIKTTKNKDGTWNTKEVLDEELSGFQDVAVPCDELYIENIYEHNIQKQSWLIWRKIISYDIAKAKHGKKENFQYVKPGVQVIYNDANQLFYDVYDDNLRAYEVEEVTYWNRAKDLKVTLLNGVLVDDVNEPNPRKDKRYPFVKFGYEYIDGGKFFYYKSLVFKMTPDASIINTLYQMVIDGTYLNIMPPMMVVGSEVIQSNVIVPGAVTTVTEDEAKITEIKPASNIRDGMETIKLVSESINESSQDPVQQGDNTGLPSTAYALSRLEQNAATVLGLFIKMRSAFVKDYGELRLQDILQYMTIADVSKLEEGNEKLVYKTFLLTDRKGPKGIKNRKIMFDGSLPSEMMPENLIEDLSFDTLEMEDGGDMELYRANPELFRNLKYILKISPDIMNPASEDLERAYNLEEYDRAIMNPLLDQEKVTRDFLLSAYSRSKKDPDQYLKKSNPMAMQHMMMGLDPANPEPQVPPMNNVRTPTRKLPQIPNSGAGAI